MIHTNEQLTAIALETYKAILNISGFNVVGSWGISAKFACEYKGMASLVLKVDAALHEGFVIISLNEARDLYEVRLANDLSKRDDSPISQCVEGIFFDALGATIDSMIERPAGISDEEYEELYKEHWKRKGLL